MGKRKTPTSKDNNPKSREDDDKEIDYSRKNRNTIVDIHLPKQTDVEYPMTHMSRAVIAARQRLKSVPKKYDTTPAAHRLPTSDSKELEETVKYLKQGLDKRYLSNGGSVEDISESLDKLVEQKSVADLWGTITRNQLYAQKLNIPEEKQSAWITERVIHHYSQ